jgi:hypothetical protein
MGAPEVDNPVGISLKIKILFSITEYILTHIICG